MPQGLTRCDSEHLFAVGTQPQAYFYNTYVNIYTDSRKINMYRHIQCSNKARLTGLQPSPRWLSGSGGWSIIGKQIDTQYGFLQHLPSGYLASGFHWILSISSCWPLSTQPPKAPIPFLLLVQSPLAHTQTHMLRMPPVTGLRHPFCLVDGSEIAHSPFDSCMMKHTHKWVSQSTSRSHSIAYSWLGPLGSSTSQLMNLCSLPGFPFALFTVKIILVYASDKALI